MQISNLQTPYKSQIERSDDFQSQMTIMLYGIKLENLMALADENPEQVL